MSTINEFMNATHLACFSIFMFYSPFSFDLVLPFVDVEGGRMEFL
jgi:hypothetical protein